jgi:hypothetical protein
MPPNYRDIRLAFRAVGRARRTPGWNPGPRVRYTMRYDIAPGGTFPEYELPDHTQPIRKLSETQGDDPLIRADPGTDQGLHGRDMPTDARR